MDLRKKNIFYTVVLLTAMLVVYWVREANNTEPPELTSFSGTTMGNITYNVKYFDPEGRVFKMEVDSLLQVFNSSLNTYIPSSEISRFNEDSSLQFVLPFFPEVLQASKEIYTSTGGAFDPTVMPLVNAWGFGPKNTQVPDSAFIDSLKQFVGFRNIEFSSEKVWKKDIRTAIDFSAIAKGQGVDVVYDFIRVRGIKDIFVEIGGEVRASGKNAAANRPWSVYILDPSSTRENLKQLAIMQLSDAGLATSGNYFNYRIVDGRKYSHTINPVSGYPIVHPLLSASVVAPTCMEADALATAFMVMGHEKAIEYLNDHPEVDAFLVFSLPDGNVSTYQSNGINLEMIDG